MAKNVFIGDDNGKAMSTGKEYIGLPVVELVNLAPAINGTEGWEATSGSFASSTSYKKYSANSLRLYGGTSNPEAHICTTEGIPIISGHTYYIRNEVLFANATYRRTACYWPIAEPNVYNSNSMGLNMSNGSWYAISVVTNRTSAGHAAGSHPYRIDFDNNYGAGYMYVDGIMIIDLTACFGSGKEPTKAWCDANIPYFTGTTKIFYDGVTSYARKILKGYIGDDNGVARLFYDADSAKTLVSIEVTTMPTKTTYTVGETFDETGLVVTATYSDGSTAELNRSQFGLTLDDFSAAGEKTIVVTCVENGVTVQTSFTVTVYSYDDLMQAVPVFISGFGSSSYCYATINDVVYYLSGSGIEVKTGDVITFCIRGNYTYPGTLKIDETTVLTVTNGQATEYEWTVPNNITGISIEFGYDSTWKTSQITVVTTSNSASYG